MASKSQLMLHVATEAFVIAAVSVFFTKKINTLTRSIDEMASHLQAISTKLEEQERIIQVLSEKIIQSEVTKRPKNKTPNPSPVLSPMNKQQPLHQPLQRPLQQQSQSRRQEDVILLNIFSSDNKPVQKPVIEVIEDEKTPEKLDSELHTELLDLDNEIFELNSIPEGDEGESVLKDEE